MNIQDLHAPASTVHSPLQVSAVCSVGRKNNHGERRRRRKRRSPTLLPVETSVRLALRERKRQRDAERRRKSTRTRTGRAHIANVGTEGEEEDEGEEEKNRLSKRAPLGLETDRQIIHGDTCMCICRHVYVLGWIYIGTKPCRERKEKKRTQLEFTTDRPPRPWRIISHPNLWLRTQIHVEREDDRERERGKYVRSLPIAAASLHT